MSEGWSIECVLGCLAPALGWLGQGDSEPEHESLIKEVVGVWALEWLVYIGKVHSQMSCFCSRNWLNL